MSVCRAMLASAVVLCGVCDESELRCDLRVPSGDLCCVILIDLVGCDCSCDGGRLTGVMHFGYMRRTAMLVTCGVISW